MQVLGGLKCEVYGFDKITADGNSLHSWNNSYLTVTTFAAGAFSGDALFNFWDFPSSIRCSIL
jgi:hypothetical protein